MSAKGMFLAISIVIAIAVMAGCAAEPEGDATLSPTDAIPVPTLTDSSTPVDVPSPGAVPMSPADTSTVIPNDCREILNDRVLTALEGVPLNDPAFGDTGTLFDGTLRCVWGDPDADTTKLTTTIGTVPYNDAMDYLNALTEEGFTCYSPDDGVRCEYSWRNERFPVTDGRTLYYRDSVLVDTQYSNLAPGGYTNAVIDALWPAGSGTPSPTPTP